MIVKHVSILLLASQSCFSLQSNSLPPRPSVARSVASRDVEVTEEKVPYVIARGDGSTGGGGLPMPHSTGEDGLTRPKVGAAMPEG